MKMTKKMSETEKITRTKIRLAKEEIKTQKRRVRIFQYCLDLSQVLEGDVWFQPFNNELNLPCLVYEAKSPILYAEIVKFCEKHGISADSSLIPMTEDEKRYKKLKGVQ